MTCLNLELLDIRNISDVCGPYFVSQYVLYFLNKTTQRTYLRLIFITVLCRFHFVKRYNLHAEKIKKKKLLTIQ